MCSSDLTAFLVVRGSTLAGNPYARVSLPVGDTTVYTGAIYLTS